MAHPVGPIDDYTKHIFPEHNQEPDHLANLGTHGQRKVTIERGENTEEWTAVRVYWDGSKKRWPELMWSRDQRC